MRVYKTDFRCFRKPLVIAINVKFVDHQEQVHLILLVGMDHKNVPR